MITDITIYVGTYKYIVFDKILLHITEKPFKLCVNNLWNIYVGDLFKVIGKLYLIQRLANE